LGANKMSDSTPTVHTNISYIEHYNRNDGSRVEYLHNGTISKTRPENDEYINVKTGHSARHYDLTEPCIEDFYLFELAETNADQERVFNKATKLYDAQNFHILASAKEIKSSLVLAAATSIEKLQQIANESSNSDVIRTMYTKNNIVSLGIGGILSITLLVIFTGLLGYIEWSNMAAVVESGNLSIALDDNSKLASLIASAGGVLGALILKFRISTGSRNSRNARYNNVLNVGVILFVILIISLVSYYVLLSTGDDSNDFSATSIDFSADIEDGESWYLTALHMVQYIVQLLLGSVVMAVIWVKLESKLLENKDIHIENNKVQLALDEKFSHYLEIDKVNKSALGENVEFEAIFLGGRTAYEEKFYSTYMVFKASYDYAKYTGLQSGLHAFKLKATKEENLA